MIEISKEVGINHLMYSGSVAADTPEKLGNFDPQSPMAQNLLSKHDIEGAVRAAAFENWTIFRPVSFMSNYLSPMINMCPDFVRQGRMVTALAEDTPVPLVDVDTIGQFSVEAFLHPDKFNRQEIVLADDCLTIGQIVQKLSRATGRPLEVEYMSSAEILEQKSENRVVAAIYVMRDLAKFVDLDKIAAWGVPTGDFDSFLAKETDRVRQTYLSD